MEKLMNSITFIYYDELRHEIITGHETGSIVIWSWLTIVFIEILNDFKTYNGIIYYYF